VIRVALFDFDKTLIGVNSGHLWLRAEWRAGRVGVRDALWAAYWFTRYHFGSADGLDRAFAQAVALYAGTPDDELATRSRRFFEEELAAQIQPGARARLEAHRSAGHRIALASSTTQYLADEATRTWGLELAACTRLAVEDGRLTGQIAASALGAHKATRVVAWAEAEGVDLRQVAFYTDSATDAALLERVGEPVAVNPDRRLRSLAKARGWRIEDWRRAP
jgi:putative phosphoserine phosphatase/1-acylglycerol-3-phosphate O-acyltransferase